MSWLAIGALAYLAVGLVTAHFLMPNVTSNLFWRALVVLLWPVVWIATGFLFLAVCIVRPGL